MIVSQWSVCVCLCGMKRGAGLPAQWRPRSPSCRYAHWSDVGAGRRTPHSGRDSRHPRTLAPGAAERSNWYHRDAWYQVIIGDCLLWYWRRLILPLVNHCLFSISTKWKQTHRRALAQARRPRKPWERPSWSRTHFRLALASEPDPKPR